MKTKEKIILYLVLPFCFSAILFLVYSAEAKNYFSRNAESLKSVKVSSLKHPEGLELETRDYTVDGKAVFFHEPFFLKFSVSSSHADYEVEGLQNFYKLLREIKVIEYLREHGTSGQAADGAINSIKDTGKGAVMLVTDPGGSAKNLGRAAGSLFGKGKRLFQKDKREEKESLGDKILGGEKRKLANELGVDVYTDNLYLQKIMTQIARDRMTGKMGVFVVKLLFPIGGLAGVAVTAAGVTATADDLANNKDPGELFEINKKELVKSGFEEDVVDKFIKNQNFNPREQTRARCYIQTFKDLKGIESIFDYCAKVDSKWDMRRIIWCLEIAAENYAEETGLISIGLKDDILYLQGDKEGIYILPYDYLFLNSKGKGVIDKCDDLRDLAGAPRADMVIAGTASRMAKAYIKEKKMDIRDYAILGG